MEQPCPLDYCFDACLPLVHFFYIFHQIFYYMLLGVRGCINVPIFSTDDLVPCSACAHQFMLGLENAPQACRSRIRRGSSGISELVSLAAEQKGSRLFLSCDAHILCCTTRFHYVIGFL